MASMVENNRARRFRGQQEEDERPDRLSDLPDNLLHQIMSFLDTKTAVQTCVLSKRWDCLWVSLADLDFDDNWAINSSGFRKFVLKVLSTRADCNICKFRINSWFDLDVSLMERVINYVVSHSVQHLDLRAGDRQDLYSLFGPLLTCNTLRTLHLSNVSFEYLPESFGFGPTMTNLSSLSLSGCCYIGGSVDPFAGCPNLKSLCLEEFDLLFDPYSCSGVLKITGLQLLNLKLDIKDGHISNHKVEIFAPKLTYFYFEGSTAIDFSSFDVPSLSCADIWLRSNYKIWEHDTLVQKKKYGLDLIDLFRRLYNAEVVSLSWVTVKILNWVPNLEEQQPAPFKRLKSLKVQCFGDSIDMPDHMKGYLLGDNPYEETMFVEGSPNGETLYAEFRKVPV